MPSGKRATQNGMQQVSASTKWRVVGVLALAAVFLGVGLGYETAAERVAPRESKPASAPQLGASYLKALPRPRNARSSAPAPTKGLHLVFDATFAGNHLNRAIWDTCYPWELQQNGCTNFGNPQEVEWYLPTRISVNDGALHLIATHTPTNGLTVSGAPKIYSYRSGMVTTYPSLDFTYGYLQIVARVPAGPDLWPALWLHPASDQPTPEVDILESGADPRGMLIAYHPPTGTVFMHTFTTANLTIGWHSFAIDWTPQSLTWYVDGTLEASVTTHVPSVPMYLIADLAVNNFAKQCSGEVVPSTCTGSMAIRSIKLWQR